MPNTPIKNIVTTRHPVYIRDQELWDFWRMTYDGGPTYVNRYLRQFTKREEPIDFQNRKLITPTPMFAKAAIVDIRNAIFQRMRDIVRRGGSESYHKAVEGDHGGVDRRGASMSSFMGINLLTELLVMGKVGVYVDMPLLDGETLAEVGGARPYMYMYRIEDVLSWSCTMPDDPNQFQAVLLRDHGVCYDSNTFGIHLPGGTFERYRMIWIDEDTGRVNIQFYNNHGNPISATGVEQPTEEPIHTDLTRIPFVMLDIGTSLLKDVAKHQVALMNLQSSDVSYALLANFPFYIEQRDLRGAGDHLKGPQNAVSSPTTGGQPGADENIKVGATQGRAYDLKAEPPNFIHPSSEPLKASMALQDKLEDDIRKLVNLAVSNKTGVRSSAESKKMDNQGLEAGLSFIGLILEAAERQVAEYWAAYENRIITKRSIATIKYPDRYSLKSDKDRIDESEKLVNLMATVPGRTAKKEMAKLVATKLLDGSTSVETMGVIMKEIDAAEYTTSDADIIIPANEAGLVGDQVASMALGFEEDEYIQADKDHMDRIERIAIAQTKGQGSKAEVSATGGNPDLSGDPPTETKEEKAGSRDTTLEDTTQSKTRGEGRQKKKD